MIKTDLESIQAKRLLCYIVPGSVCLDFKPDDWKSLGVLLIWELCLLLFAPFVPLLLVYNAIIKSLSLFDLAEFNGNHTLAFNIVELIFETTPQLILQCYLRFHDHDDIPLYVIEYSILVCLMSLIKIPLMLIWNRSLIKGLVFKRHHNSVVKSVKFHPTQDILASGSWDNTVLFHSVLKRSMLKAKRVAPCGSMKVNCIAFSEDGRLMAVGGHGLRIYDMNDKKFIKKLPKRDKTTSKRPRGAEMSHLMFDRTGKLLICGEGQVINVYNVELGDICNDIQVVNKEARGLGSISAMALSPSDSKILVTSITTSHDIT
eukprot:UN32336